MSEEDAKILVAKLQKMATDFCLEGCEPHECHDSSVMLEAAALIERLLAEAGTRCECDHCVLCGWRRTK